MIIDDKGKLKRYNTNFYIFKIRYLLLLNSGANIYSLNSNRVNGFNVVYQ